MTRRTKRRLLVGLAVLAVVLVALALNSMRGRLGWSALPQTPAELTATLAPGMTWTTPEGEGPYPAAIIMSGCDGPKSNLDRMARDLAEAGWLSVIVDSHGPRGLDNAQLWRLVCAGQILNGAERAADVAVALSMIRARPDTDPGRVALIGLSHGGWTVLDFLSLADAGEVPPLLTEWPENLGDPAWEGVRAASLFYPYCGPASIGSRANLPLEVEYLFLLVRDDSIVEEDRCREIAEQIEEAGGEVRVFVFDGVTHGFDQVEKNEFSNLEFDEPTRDEAVGLTVDMLGNH